MRQHILTLFAYLSAFKVSSKLDEAGLTQQIIKVLAFPPNESCNYIYSQEKHFRKSELNTAFFMKIISQPSLHSITPIKMHFIQQKISLNEDAIYMNRNN